MDSGTRTCSDLRMDRDVHPGHRLLFDSEVASHESIWAVSRCVVLGVVDVWRHSPLAKQCLPMAGAFSAPAFGSPRTCCLPDLLSYRFKPPAARLRQDESGRVGIRDDRCVGWPPPHTLDYLRSLPVSCTPGQLAGVAREFRPAIPGSTDLGFPG